MAIRIMSQVWEFANVGGNELLVLLALADFSDNDGFCWPSMASIAGKTRISERGARGIIRRLEQAGMLTCEPSKGRSSNRYRITLNPEASAGLDAPNPEDDAALNPEAGAGSKTPNPEAGDTQPGSLLPPNRQETSKETVDDAGASAFLDKIVEAAKADVSKAPWYDFNVSAAVLRWRELKLDDDEILTTVRAVAGRRRDPSPIGGPSYFDNAMQLAAGEKARPALTPIDGGRAGHHRVDVREALGLK